MLAQAMKTFSDSKDTTTVQYSFKDKKTPSGQAQTSGSEHSEGKDDVGAISVNMSRAVLIFASMPCELSIILLRLQARQLPCCRHTTNK